MRATMYFPYPPRAHQLEVLRKISRGIRRWHVCLHAPTGFGKTPVILAALIPYVKRGYRVIWAVRTGNETDRPIEELKVIVEGKGLEVFGLSYRGKRDMCLLAMEYGEELTHSEVTFLCSVRRNRCPYYRRYREKIDPAYYSQKGPLTYSEVFEISKELSICPYYTQRYLLKLADVVSLSYNYVVDPRLEWSLKRLVPFRSSILVVDEAHNLQSIGLGSDTITTGTVKRSIREAESSGEPEIAELLEFVLSRMEERFGDLGEDKVEVFDPLELLPPGGVAKLREAERLGNYLRRRMLEEGKRPRSSLHHFAEFMISSMELRGARGIALIAEREGGIIRLSIWDMRAAEILSERWGEFRRCIFCSGTLKPIEAFAETIGLTNYVGVTVPNIFKKRNLSISILRQVTTRGEELGDIMARRYVRAIADFLRTVRTNTAVFTSSYRVQQKLMDNGLLEEAEKLGYRAMVEIHRMSGQEARKMLDGFKKFAEEGSGLLIGPMGGRFAEGADFPGEQLQAIFLVGIPFERPTVKTQLYIQYYSELYGEEKGRLYAYILPALKRASQALGRAIRSPDDKGVFILGDERYEKYLDLLPDYVREWYNVIEPDMLKKIRVPWHHG